jgi:hypothetical protein
VIVELHVDLLGLHAVSPVKVTGLERVRFEQALLLALCLDDLNGHVCLVDDHVSWLELDDLREAEGVGQVVYVGHDLVHAVCAVLSAAVFQEDRLALQFRHVKRKLSPVRVADFHADALDVVLNVFGDVFQELFLVVLADALNILLPLLLVDQKLFALVLRAVREQDHSLQLLLVLKRGIVDFGV